MLEMSRFCLPRDIYHGKGCLEELKNLKGKKAMLVVGGGSMRRQGFLDKAVNYLKEAGMEVELFEGVEPDPSVETVMRGAEAMRALVRTGSLPWAEAHRSMRRRQCGRSMNILRLLLKISVRLSTSQSSEQKQNSQPSLLHQELRQRLPHSQLSQTIRLG